LKQLHSKSRNLKQIEAAKKQQKSRQKPYKHWIEAVKQVNSLKLLKK